MGTFRDRFSNFFRRSQPITSQSAVAGRMLGDRFYPTGITRGADSLTNSDVFAVVNQISSDIANLKFSSDIPLTTKALNQPHAYTNGFSFWQSVTSTLLLYGNCYVLIIKNNANQFSGLELLQEHQIESFIQRENDSLQYQIRFDDDRPTTLYDSSEVLHFKLLSVGDDQSSKLLGRSPLMSLVPELEVQALSNKLTSESLKNGINPQAVLTVPGAQLDQEAKGAIRDAFLEGAQSAQGAPIVLDQSVELSRIDIKPEIASFLNNLSYTRTQIAKVFGVPDSLLNGQGDQQSSLDMISTMYHGAMLRYQNAILSELQLKLGVAISMNDTLTDDQQIDRVIKLANANILTPQQSLEQLSKEGIVTCQTQETSEQPPAT